MGLLKFGIRIVSQTAEPQFHQVWQGELGLPPQQGSGTWPPMATYGHLANQHGPGRAAPCLGFFLLKEVTACFVFVIGDVC